MKNFTQIISIFLFFMGLLPAAYAQTNFKIKSSNGANIRQGPSSDKQVITTIPAGSKIKVVDRSNASWYKVEYDGKTGYVSSSLIEEDNNRNSEKNKASSDERSNSSSNNNSNAQPSQTQRKTSAAHSSKNKNSSNNRSRSKSSSASSGDYNWGIGLRLGDPVGITVKKYNGNNAWEFNLGRSSRWGYNYGNGFYRYSKYDDKNYYHYSGHVVGFSTSLQVHYLWQKPINGAEGLSLYYGVGAQARFTPITYRYYYNTNGGDWWKDWNYREDRVTNIDLGVDGTLGLEYKFRNAPFSMFLDATLFMEVVDAPFLFSGQGGIGVRYNF